MHRPPVFLLATLFFAVCNGCRSPYYADQGAGLGAVTGALAGAAIGEHNGNPLAGALIGAAGGGLAGAAIGDAIDADVARNQAIIDQRMGRQMAAAANIPDVISMTRAGLSDDVIVTHIRARGVAQAPNANDLITLRNAGVSDPVIRAMQEAPSPTASPPVVYAPRPRPVIVEEYYYAPPPPRWVRHHHHHHPPVCDPHFEWGFSFHGH